MSISAIYAYGYSSLYQTPSNRITDTIISTTTKQPLFWLEIAVFQCKISVKSKVYNIFVELITTFKCGYNLVKMGLSMARPKQLKTLMQEHGLTRDKLELVVLNAAQHQDIAAAIFLLTALGAK